MPARTFHEDHSLNIIFILVTCSSITVQYCSDPGPIENGKMEGDARFTCISTVKYTCNEGYWLLGAETLRCGIDGLWDHGKPVCIDKGKKHDFCTNYVLTDLVFLSHFN